MRVAVIVVSMLMAATPSEASKSCMSKTEARQHFGSVHIYWHGQDPCWDATPTRQRTNDEKVQQKNDQPKWRDAISEMLADDEPAPTLGARTSWDAQHHGNDAAAASTPWVDRWVDIVQVAPPLPERNPQPMVAPPPIIERRSEPMVTAGGVTLVFIAISLILAIVIIYERPTSRRNTRPVG